jgi:predicted enzyme related to lactoylglutathione lyase
LYIEVDDVATYVSKAIELGGQVVMPIQQLPDGDVMAIILDIEGIPVGLFKSANDEPMPSK